MLRNTVAYSTLVALAWVALASCGGGPGAAHPDLVVEAPEVSDHRPAAGESFTFSATVRNAGRGHAAATTLRVYRSDDETITTDDEQVDAVTVAGLATSESMVARVPVTAPRSPGTYYYGACVDPVAGESDTANNCSAAIQGPQVQHSKPASPPPDLVVESPAVSPDGPAAATSFTFTATVRNAGGGSAGATTLRVYRSHDETITTDDERVATAAVRELAASERSPASVELSAPSSSGTYYYGACVDAVAEESATANNCSGAVPVTVQAPQVPVSGPPGPDLVVKRVWVRPESPPIGGNFDLLADVRNRGGGTSPYTILRFYRSTDATVTRSDTQVATEVVTRLRIDSAEYDGHDYVDLQAPSSKGTYYYGACVDAVAGESDTTNNCSAAVTVEVSHNSPDLWVVAWSTAGTFPTATSSSLRTRVGNSGSPSEETKVRLIRLPDWASKPSAGTQVSEVDVPELVATQGSPAFSTQFLKYRSPATAGRYYYAICVDAVARESDTTNNCSVGSIQYS
ncbi:MAG: hypothetical protein OXP69_07950 [Spirochaetaceae bacterium]|nr:hypothetical protein [Spirochaetaceae bacterium]